MITTMNSTNSKMMVRKLAQQGSPLCEYKGSFTQIEGTQPVISVLVAVHNVSKYLDRCLNSLATQTFQDVEFIVVDDGSTDSSAEICDKYQAIDVRFKVIHQKNSGILSTRKRGIEEANGQYCIFLDGDDFLVHFRVLELLVKMLKNERADILQYRVNVIGKNKTQIEEFHGWFDPKIDNKTVYSSQNILRACFVEEQFRWSLWDKVYKTSVLKQAAKWNLLGIRTTFLKHSDTQTLFTFLNIRTEFTIFSHHQIFPLTFQRKI